MLKELRLVAIAARLFAVIVFAESVDKGTEKGNKTMTLRDYLEMRKRGWSDAADDDKSMAERYTSKIFELDCILTGLSDASLDAKISLRMVENMAVPS